MRLITLLLILAYCTVKGQTKSIKIISSSDRYPISNVLVYSNNNNLIGNTDSLGNVNLELKNMAFITFVKEDFRDLLIDVKDLEGIVVLAKNSPIQLKEVVVTHFSDEDILNRIEASVKKMISEKYLGLKPATYAQYYNLFISGNDTLQFLNNRFKYVDGKGVLMENKNRIFKNFKFLSKNIRVDSCVYFVNNKTVEFSDILTLPYQSINNEEQLSNIIKNKKNYTFSINRDSSYYKVEFVPKSVRPFSYSGFFTVDVNDFGFYEFSLSLVENKANTKLVKTKLLPSVKQTFYIKKENYYIKYKKIDNQYIFDYSKSHTTYFQREGNFKNRSFVNDWRIETTPKFESNSLLKLNFLNWDIK